MTGVHAFAGHAIAPVRPLSERSASFTPHQRGTFAVTLWISPSPGEVRTVKRPEGRAPAVIDWGAKPIRTETVLGPALAVSRVRIAAKRQGCALTALGYTRLD
jgi:hypothetical protein